MSTSTASQQIANPTLDIIPTLSTIPEASSDIESQFDVSTIEGNAEPWLKERVGDTATFFRGGRIPGVEGPLYCEWMYKRFKVTEVSILHKAEEPRKTEGRVVVEIDVTEDMLNPTGTMHGACAGTMIDMCSTLAIHALVLAGSEKEFWSVSQSMNLAFHSPALVGDRLRLVNTTLTIGGRTNSAKTEIWNLTHHRLVASGTHIKMSPPPGLPVKM